MNNTAQTTPYSWEEIVRNSEIRRARVDIALQCIREQEQEDIQESDKK
ncbi:hypothetical protein [Beggiatoa leptomitoformis]|uniref:Uncharacterized protein n=1 Tax=Beggiatoa leptomitoformis TaxID=288004 RepID=A0A650GCX5_9GAMM|nr:hypothetical protein [Beggiatoa leptomitoformis]QGX03724.1 hypothetical protein AL038_19100 [Beggiatoa leptomitoformis]QGX04100.1 hypothetical protein BLE401_18670 [Beggiatoa leptomitoformis]